MLSHKLLPPRTHVSRQLELGAEPGLSSRHSVKAAGVRGSVLARQPPQETLFILTLWPLVVFTDVPSLPPRCSLLISCRRTRQGSELVW